MNNRAMVIGGVILSFAVGAASGYLFAKKKLDHDYQEAVKEELRVAKNYYSQLYKGEGFDSPEAAAESLGVARNYSTDEHTLERIVTGLKYRGNASVPIIDKNAFDGQVPEDSDTDYSADEKKRNSETPYIVSLEEFMDGTSGFDQVTLTYWSVDDVISDHEDDMVEDWQTCVGSGNLRFGYRSRDLKTVYIRNEKLRIDYEIVKNESSYAVEVAGFEPPEEPKRKGRR